MINKLQYYTSDNTDPYENLAIEKYLFDIADKDTMILYLWQNENTVVIGRNQNPWSECRTQLLKEEGGKLARRLSGGGAVYHDLGNLNFTFISSAENSDLKKQLQVIQKACSFCGIETELSGRNDILADGKKFSGNAFFNTKEKVYHHGTILISADVSKMMRYLTPPKAKIESKGIKSVRSRVINLSELKEGLTISTMAENMLKAFEAVFNLTPKELPKPVGEKILSLSEKYKSSEYLYGLHFPFTFSCEEYFTWGTVSLNVRVEKGKISEVKVYTDSMDWELSAVVEKALLYCMFDKKACMEALEKVLPPERTKDFMELIDKII